MIKLQVQGFTQDMGEFDTWNDIHELDLDPKTPIDHVVEYFFREERNFDDNDINHVRDLINNPGKWNGGCWERTNETTLQFTTDVTSEKFQIVE